MKHLSDLTCCRAIFAAWVFTYHLNLEARYAPSLGVAGAFVQRGNLGVDGFFILSGMILAYAHPDLTPGFAEARSFWGKRLARIYPVHLAMIVALALLVASAWALEVHPRQPDRFGLGELVSHLALVHAWGFSDRWAWNYPSWSISAEWAGYLLFPFLWTLLRGQNGIGVAVVLPLTLLGVIAARVIGHAQGLSLTYDGGLIRFFPEFIAGMAILPLLPLLPRWLNGHAVALVGGVGFVAAAVAAAEVLTIVAMWLMLLGLMLAGEQGRSELLGRIPALRWLGEVSYSYYMSFALVETMQATLWRRLAVLPLDHPVLYVLMTTTLTLGLATLAWALVERPALRAYAAYTQRRARLGGYPARL
ncbi:MAG: acyltransferase [Rhodospirillales bacterium]|nr:acyltransferase [Rhodospirillales bacterium]